MPIGILIVEDSAIMRKIIEKTISMCGIDNGHLFEASNGKEGLVILENNEIDLLLIDINMPVMNGQQMLDEIRRREQTKDLPVLVVSSESNEVRIDEFKKQGAEFIHKPFTPEMLREKMMHLIDIA